MVHPCTMETLNISEFPYVQGRRTLCLIIIFAMAMFDSINRLSPSDASALNQDSARSFLAPLDAAEWDRAFDRFRKK